MVRKIGLVGVFACTLLVCLLCPVQQTYAISVSITLSGGCGSTYCIGEYATNIIRLNENAYIDVWVETATDSWYNIHNEYFSAGTYTFGGTVAGPEGPHTIYVRARSLTGSEDQDSCTYYVTSCGSQPTSTPKSSDSDKDGVKDSSDQCYNPNCSQVDSSGCPKDSDSDGVNDCDDDCPYDKGPSSRDGCPEPTGDKDNDGVKDDRDGCYNPGCGVVDSSGCPKDSDSDGVNDCDDDCPYDKGPSSRDGCPEPTGDKDNDGVKDDRDGCYNPGCGVVDSSGCPKDSDSDGVNDCDDQCIYDKGPASNNGCPDDYSSNILDYWWVIAVLFCVLGVLIYLNRKRPPKLKM